MARNVPQIFDFVEAASARRCLIVVYVGKIFRDLCEQQTLAVAFALKDLCVVARLDEVNRIDFRVDEFFLAELNKRHEPAFTVPRQCAW